MDLLSFFKRTAAAPAAKPVSDSLDAVQELRLRARRRLIGAAVLVGIGVIGFPLVFETQPRPIPVDLPIEIPRKDALPPLAIPAPVPAPAASQEAPVSADKLGQGIITEAREPEPAPTVAPVAKPVEKAKPETKPEIKAEKKAPDTPKPDAKAEAARVQALLEGKPAVEKKASDAVAGARFIVQVGAYAEAKAVQEARSRVEKLGLKTYTQAVETADGKRIRVRLGPFASREEADKAAAKVRGAGLSTAVLTL